MWIWPKVAILVCVCVSTVSVCVIVGDMWHVSTHVPHKAGVQQHSDEICIVHAGGTSKNHPL